MTQIDLSNIKSNHPLPAFLQRDGIKLVRSSNHFACLCPFHRERTPSCHVWDHRFHCFGCGMDGDIFDYLQKTRGITFTEALRVLGGFIEKQRPAPTVLSHVIRKEEPPKPEPRDFSGLCSAWSMNTNEDRMTDLAAKLGISAESLWWLGTGWAPEHKAWSFPMFDAKKHVIGVRLRDERGRKWAVPGSRNGLFISSLPADRRMFVCEGPTDTAAALSIGFYAIGRASCNSCVEMILEFLKRNRKIVEVVVCSDNDSPGLAGARALREKLPVRSWLLLLPVKDVRRFCQSGGERATIEAMISMQTPKVSTA